MNVSGHLRAPAALPPGKTAPGTHWMGGWLGPRDGLDNVKKKYLPYVGNRTPSSHSARNYAD
jgi:hypothetical protein